VLGIYIFRALGSFVTRTDTGSWFNNAWRSFDNLPLPGLAVSKLAVDPFCERCGTLPHYWTWLPCVCKFRYLPPRIVVTQTMQCSVHKLV
jgi:hypothetical protein